MMEPHRCAEVSQSMHSVDSWSRKSSSLYRWQPNRIVEVILVNWFSFAKIEDQASNRWIEGSIPFKGSW